MPDAACPRARVRPIRLAAGTLVVATVAALLGLGALAQRAAAARPGASLRCPWLDDQLPVARRVSMLMSHMTLAQKIGEMHVDAGALTGPYAGDEGYVPAQPSLCIPDLVEQDDSVGVAGVPGATQLPSEVALGATWDPSLARDYGAVNGRQHFGKGIALALAPGLNIQRDPRWGRNFEMFSEDPLLTARMGAADIAGMQAEHEMADVKHFAVYNEETNRNTPADDAIVGQRALHEIYLAPFDTAVTQAHAASVMCSYALLNDRYSCEDPQLSAILDDRWGFRGFLRSDGGANRSTAASVNAGLDQERGSAFWSGSLLADAVHDGQVPAATIDQAVARILGEMFRFNLFAHPPTGTLASPVQTPRDVALARLVAERSTVLLRDAGHLLPLDPAATHSIAVIGSDGTTAPRTAGGGSSYVTPTAVANPLAAIAARAGPGVAVSSYSGRDPAQAAAAAQSAQVAIVFASQLESEGSDVTSLALPGRQNALISAVAAANPNTIVVLDTGGPVAMPWLGQVRAALEAWYPGQADGDALAAVLFGDVDPAGHLPETFPASLSQVPADTPARWPGTHDRVDYSEGLDVGYRHDAAQHVTPLFPFGFGLSYTRFAFRRLRIHADTVNATSGPDGGQAAPVATVTARVTNVGRVTGGDVAQLYLADPRAAHEPPEQLEGFTRVRLTPGHSATVRFVLGGHALSWYDPGADGWVLSDGRYRVAVGDSSASAAQPLHGAFTVRRSVGARRATLAAPGAITPGRPFTAVARFVNPGGVTQPAGPARVSAPAGWRVVPASAPVGPIAPGANATRRFRVLAPHWARVRPVVLHASLRGGGPAGAGDLATYRRIAMTPAVSVSAVPVLVAAAGGRTRTRVVLTSHLAHRVAVVLAPRAAGGVAVAPRRVRVRVPAFAHRSVALAVTAPAGIAPGARNLALGPSSRGVALPPAQLHVAEPYPNLAAAARSTAISDDSDPIAADFDGAGDSYSAQALAAAGLSPGATITVPGGSAQWPTASPGTPDSVLADGQTISLPAAGGEHALVLVGASSNASLRSPGTIEYAGGATQRFSLALDNWSLPPADRGDQVVATMPYVNGFAPNGATAPGQRRRTVRVFATTIALNPRRTVTAVTLPRDGDSLVGAAMHVFALGVS